MTKLVPKGKMSKKARKALDDKKRVTWGFAPTNRKVESAKCYRRANKAQRKAWEDRGRDEA